MRGQTRKKSDPRSLAPLTGLFETSPAWVNTPVTKVPARRVTRTPLKSPKKMLRQALVKPQVGPSDSSNHPVPRPALNSSARTDRAIPLERLREHLDRLNTLPKKSQASGFGYLLKIRPLTLYTCVSVWKTGCSGLKTTTPSLAPSSKSQVELLCSASRTSVTSWFGVQRSPWERSVSHSSNPHPVMLHRFSHIA